MNNIQCLSLKFQHWYFISKLRRLISNLGKSKSKVDFKIQSIFSQNITSDYEANDKRGRLNSRRRYVSTKTKKRFLFIITLKKG